MLHGYKHTWGERWFMWKAAFYAKVYFRLERYYSEKGRHDLAAKYEKEAEDWLELGWECYHGM